MRGAQAVLLEQSLLADERTILTNLLVGGILSRLCGLVRTYRLKVNHDFVIVGFVAACNTD